MRWVAVFDDDQNAKAVREQHTQEHFDYLAAHQDRIVLAGGLRPAPEEFPCGALWVMEVDSREEALDLIEQDPFFRLGLRKGYRLLTWGKAPCYDRVCL